MFMASCLIALQIPRFIVDILKACREFQPLMCCMRERLTLGISAQTLQWNLRKRTLPREDTAPRADSCVAPFELPIILIHLNLRGADASELPRADTT